MQRFIDLFMLLHF